MSKQSKKEKTLREIIDKEYEKGNIVVSTPDGLYSGNILKFIEKDVECMLYDLNRCESVVLTFINDPKWINDFAVCKTIRALKSKIDELELQLKINEPNNNTISTKSVIFAE